jgi:hypothetical protein
LLVPTWLTRNLPPRDYLLGDILCTTSRWLIFGETGIGKTLFALDLGGSVASGQSFLNWEGRRRARVMYLDGELPAETFKERMEIVAERYGPDLSLWGYNRDVLDDDDMPALNTPAGFEWLMREIDVVKPDLIIFDAIMCLLAGSMSEEESWAPVKALMRQLSARRIAEIWLHHAGHDATKGFGTKTREWEMDTVIALLKTDQEDDDGSIRLEFRKARLARHGDPICPPSHPARRWRLDRGGRSRRHEGGLAIEGTDPNQARLPCGLRSLGRDR